MKMLEKIKILIPMLFLLAFANSRVVLAQADVCQAAFYATPTDVPFTLQFHDESYAPTEILSWSWQFGDGETSTEQNPLHTYAEEGAYDVTLTIASGDCESSQVFPVQVTGIDPTLCETFFYADPVDSLTLDFVAIGFNPSDAASYSWDFGDGTTGEGQTISHTYAGEGEYEVTLTMTDGDCTATATNTVYVGEPQDCDCPDIYDPVCVDTEEGTISFPNSCFAECAGFTDYQDCEGDTSICEAFFYAAPVDSLTYDFVAIAYNPSDAATYAWDFGDGSTGEGAEVSHTYAEAGTYMVTLDYADGDCATSVAYEIVVEEGGCFCDQQYDPVCVTTQDGEVISFPNACFAECEGYTDYYSCDEDTLACEVFFYSEPTEELTYVFYAFAYSQTDGGTYTWDFGDGNTGEGDQVSHTYAEAGTYEVTVTYTNGDCTTEMTEEINTEEDDCICPEIYDPVCVATPNGEILSFPNACYAECEGYTHYYSCDGDTTICEVFFYGEPTEELTYVFYAFAYPQADEGTYTWEFGDGSTGEGAEVSHTYAEAGTYEVTVTYTNGDCSSEMTQEINTEGDDCNCSQQYDPVCVATPSGEVISFPNACFAECEGYTDYYSCDGDTTSVCQAGFYYYQEEQASFTVNFGDVSYGNVNSWAWSFGDGTGSDEQNPVHTYAEEGEYTVSLSITTEDGCSSTVEDVIWVGDGDWYPEDCQAFFWFDLGEDPMSLQFTDYSFGDISSWAWDFGDGTTSDEQNPTHLYAEEGTYTVTLTIEGDDCTSTFPMEVWVNEALWYSEDCQALFIPFVGGQQGMDDSTGVEIDNLAVLFVNISQGDAINSTTWDFGDGTGSSDYMPYHFYEAAGTYEVTLAITTEDGCTSEFAMTLNLEDGTFTGDAAAAARLLETGELQSIESVKVAPNPVSDRLDVTFTSKTANDYQLVVTDVAGIEYFRTNSRAVTGTNAVTVNTTALPSGLYFARIQMADKVKTIKFVRK